MKKLLLVSIIFVIAVFLYQNVELDLLSNSQKQLLLKEINIVNQLDLHQEMKNRNQTEATIEIEATNNKEISTNKSSDIQIDKYYHLVKEFISTHKPSLKSGQINQAEDQEQQKDPQIKENQQHTTVENLLKNSPIDPSNLDILSLIQKVSFEDQLKVANILLKRFSFSELNEYRNMVNNGITGEEKDEIKKTVLSRLTEEDLIGLKKIAEAYVVEYYPEQQERFNSLANRYLERQ